MNSQYGHTSEYQQYISPKYTAQGKYLGWNYQNFNGSCLLVGGVVGDFYFLLYSFNSFIQHIYIYIKSLIYGRHSWAPVVQK